MPDLPNINIVTIGHVDHGKSTLIGRLLYDSGAIKEDRLRELENTAKKLGKKFEFAFILDTFEEEREGGLTIDIMHTPFQSKKYSYTIIDCPGHKEFIKKMVTGASHAEAAILVVSAMQKEGVQEQTKEHAWLAKTLGIDQMVVAVNKMDTVDYSKERFEKLSEEVKTFLKSIGYNTEKIPFIPISAMEGDNVYKKSKNMPWCNEYILIDVLDKIVVPLKPPINKPLRIPIQDVYTIDGDSLVIGRVETGVLRIGDKILFKPSCSRGEIQSIEILKRNKSIAMPGDNIGFRVKYENGGNVKRGDVCGHLKNPPNVAKEFTAQIILLEQSSDIKVGCTLDLRCGTANIKCKIEKILTKIDPASGKPIEKNPTSIKSGEAALTKILPLEPIVIEKQCDIPQLGRFIIHYSGITVAAGIVLEIKN